MVAMVGVVAGGVVGEADGAAPLPPPALGALPVSP